MSDGTPFDEEELIMSEPFSLIDFVDRVGERLFYDRPPEVSGPQLAAVAALQGKPGAYAGMFALPEADRGREFRIFTGERITTNAGKIHVIGEETCRILRLLDGSSAVADRALAGMRERIREADEREGGLTGTYCCGTCSCAFWRNLAQGCFDRQEERLELGMRTLRSSRDGKGRWGRFPFYYTLLALSEMPRPIARAEIEYALPGLEKMLKRKESGEPSAYFIRRRDLSERIVSGY
jgi:hypothetical protein